MEVCFCTFGCRTEVQGMWPCVLYTIYVHEFYFGLTVADKYTLICLLFERRFLSYVLFLWFAFIALISF
jgi:hypothetical protein